LLNARPNDKHSGLPIEKSARPRLSLSPAPALSDPSWANNLGLFQDHIVEAREGREDTDFDDYRAGFKDRYMTKTD